MNFQTYLLMMPNKCLTWGRCSTLWNSKWTNNIDRILNHNKAKIQSNWRYVILRIICTLTEMHHVITFYFSPADIFPRIRKIGKQKCIYVVFQYIPRNKPNELLRFWRINMSTARSHTSHERQKTSRVRENFKD